MTGGRVIPSSSSSNHPNSDNRFTCVLIFELESDTLLHIFVSSDTRILPKQGKPMNIDNNKGSALVEMALILLLLLLIVFGIFEFGRVMYITNTLNNAAREGARKAAVSPTPINIDAHVRECIPFDQSGLEIIISGPVSSGAPITVTVTLPFRTVTEMTPMLDGRVLRGEATMRYEL